MLSFGYDVEKLRVALQSAREAADDFSEPEGPQVMQYICKKTNGTVYSR
jgi:hypothetical protein